MARRGTRRGSNGKCRLEGQHGADPSTRKGVEDLRKLTFLGCCVVALGTAVAQDVEPHERIRTLEALRLPDVQILSAVHHVASKGQVDADLDVRREINVAHVVVHGAIGGKIQFEVLLPDEWNARFVMGGGGGFVGRVQNQARYSINRGFATAGTDTGHQAVRAAGARWALNDVEAKLNFAHLAIHRTTEVAKAIIHAYYGSDPEYSYFSGCSTGGGQALIEAQRYPLDFDGILSAAPVVNTIGLAAARIYNAQQFFPDPEKLKSPIITEERLDEIASQVVEYCEERDGVKDGVLDDPRECDFDLSQVEGLTTEQRRALQAVYDGPPSFPGMPLGSESRWYTWKAGSFPELLSQAGVPNPGFGLGISYAKYFLFDDPDWDYSTYDLADWEKDTRLASTYTGANNPDLRKFKERGGKLILWHGWSDGPLTPLASIDYFEAVAELDADLRDYFRLFLLPGVAHCGGGSGPDQVDWLGLLVDWVEERNPPHRVVASKLDDDGVVVRTRPVYPYPIRAVYTGSGDPNEAESFQPPREVKP